MCFFESEKSKKRKFISKLCIGFSIDIAIERYIQSYPNDQIVIECSGKYKKIIQKRYTEFCIEPLENYWVENRVTFIVMDGILSDIIM